jgi:hypothetical protein
MIFVKVDWHVFEIKYLWSQLFWNDFGRHCITNSCSKPIGIELESLHKQSRNSLEKVRKIQKSNEKNSHEFQNIQSAILEIDLNLNTSGILLNWLLIGKAG